MSNARSALTNQQSGQQPEYGDGEASPARKTVMDTVSNVSEALTQDSILKYHAECKLENKLRLK